jgi:lipoprotein-releasing system permease protein
MDLEFFIAKRLYAERKGDKRISRPAVSIAQWGMAVGTVVMIVSISIIVGFKKEVREKIFGFGGHMQITGISTDNANDGSLIADNTMLTELAAIEGVEKVQPFIQKVGMVIANSEYEGVVIKGIGSGYDTEFISSCIIEGSMPEFNDTVPSEKIVISSTLADKVKASLGDKLTIYFIKKGMKARRLEVAAIYRTHITELDNAIAITDLYTTQSVNDWEKNVVSGIEISVNDHNRTEEIREQAVQVAEQAALRNGDLVAVSTIEELYPGMFTWLGVLDQTVWIILILVICIAAFTMTSGLLILILEKSNHIGILKAIGTKNASIRKIFIYYACFIIGKGMILGNIIGIALCLIQQQTGIISIDPQMYYMDRVPIEFSWLLIPVNIPMFIISAAVLVVPSMLISKIEPTKAIKFE